MILSSNSATPKFTIIHTPCKPLSKKTILFLLSFKGSKGSDWHCISVSFSVQPNEDFYFVITVYQESVSGKGTFAIDEIRMSEGNCTAICK